MRPWLFVGCIACAADDPGVVAVTHLDAGVVRTYDLATGSPADVWSPTDRAVSPAALWASDEGLVVTDFRTGDVLRRSWDGAWSTLHSNAGLLPPLRLEEPCALADADGALLVLGNDSRNLVVLGEGAAMDATLRGAHDVAVEGDGTVWVGTSPVQRGLGLVQRRDLATGALVGHLAPYPDVAEATAVLRQGDALLVADWFSGAVTAWDPDSGAALGVVADGLDGPVALAEAPDGALLVLDMAGLWRIDARGAVVVAPLVPDGWVRDLVVLPRL